MIIFCPLMWECQEGRRESGGDLPRSQPEKAQVILGKRGVRRRPACLARFVHVFRNNLSQSRHQYSFPGKSLSRRKSRTW